LILKDKNGKLYGAEVKPEYSKETWGRMVAETLSYTIGTKYKLAIVVFDASEHKQKDAIDWFRKKGNEGYADWKTIEKYVKVFIVRYKDKGKTAEFEILPY